MIYKILLPPEWAQFDRLEQFDGSALDLTSGFIHCSSRAQVGATALRFFAGEPSLVVVSLETDMLGEAVRWEAAPSEELFPHVYAPLPRRAVAWAHEVAGADLASAIPAEEELGG